MKKYLYNRKKYIKLMFNTNKTNWNPLVWVLVFLSIPFLKSY